MVQLLSGSQRKKKRKACSFRNSQFPLQRLGPPALQTERGSRCRRELIEALETNQTRPTFQSRNNEARKKKKTLKISTLFPKKTQNKKGIQNPRRRPSTCSSSDAAVAGAVVGSALCRRPCRRAPPPLLELPVLPSAAVGGGAPDRPPEAAERRREGKRASASRRRPSSISGPSSGWRPIWSRRSSELNPKGTLQGSSSLPTSLSPKEM